MNKRSEHKVVGSVIVTKHAIAGTGCVVFAAYEPSSLMGPHASLYSIAGHGWCGSLPSRRLPAEIDALPVGPARWAAVSAFRAANEAEAYAAIVAAFPEAASGLRSCGEIVLGA